MQESNEKRYGDKQDLILDKKVLELAERENIDITNLKMISLTEDKTEIRNATDVKKEIDKIVDIKNKIFGNLNFEQLLPEEYDRLLDRFYNETSDGSRNYDVEQTKNRYPNINFDNLEMQTLHYIAFGDYLYSSINQDLGEDFDYSCVILQWCRAVELELRSKIYKFLDDENIKYDISNASKKTEYYINQMNKFGNARMLIPNNMMGFYSAMNKYNLVEYIFNSYIKDNYSNFTYEDFKNVIYYVGIVNKYRDDSAHSIPGEELNKSSADTCKEYITSSKKILEILSNLR